MNTLFPAGPSTRAGLAVLALLVCTLATPSAFAQAFTYQGRLDQAGVPANGGFDFQFGLFTVPTGGTQLGFSIQFNAVPVTDGLFTATPSFTNAFTTGLTGSNRYLEVRVRPAGIGSFTTLTPRQIVTPAPYAITSMTEPFVRAPDLVTLTNVAGTARVFINRTLPLINDEVLGVTVPASAAGGGMAINHASATGTPELAFLQAGTLRGTLSASSSALAVNMPGNPVTSLRIANSGVGINLNTPPTQALEVAGETSADNYLYRAPLTRTLTIGPESFRSDNSAAGVFGEGNAYLNTGVTGNMVAPLHFPDGAVVSAMIVTYVDNAAADLTVAFRMRAPASTGYLAQLALSTSSASAAVRTAQTTSSVPLNSANTYSVRVGCPAWGGTATAIKGVQFTYTVPGPD